MQWLKSNRLRVMSWAALALGWIALSNAPALPAPYREAATIFGWIGFFAGWTQVSPCAGGACALPPKSEKGAAD